jgi:cysteine desulfurase
VGSLEPSHVVIAMGVSREKANALVRLSLGKENTPQQIDRVAQMLPTIINRCQPVNG